MWKLKAGAASIVFALAGLALGGAAPPQEQAPSGKAAEQIQPAAPSTPDYSPYADQQADSCYYAQDHDAADLCAQWRAALAAEKAAELSRTGNLIGGAGVLFSFLSIVLVFFALRQTEHSLVEARKANKLAHDASQRELRAYVNVTQVAVSPFESGRVPVFALELTNTGNTPARDVRLISQPFFYRPKKAEPKIRFKELTGIGSRMALAPHKPVVHPCGLLAALTRGQAEDLNKGHLGVIYAGVVIYRDIFKRRHFTTFKVRFDREIPIGDNGLRAMAVCQKGNTVS